MTGRRYNLLSLAAIMLLFLLLGSDALASERAFLRWLRNKPKIDSIAVKGNQYFSAGDIKKRMYSRNYTVWSALRGDRRARVQRETLARDTLEIKYLYLTNGFLGIQVSESFALLEPDSTALVNVSIDEGFRYFYSTVSLQGDHPQKLDYELRKKTRQLKSSEPVDLFAIRQVAFDVKTVLANHGYPYAEVSFTVDSTHGEDLPIVFNVRADSLVRFGDLAILGTDVYPDYTARRESKIKKGNIYRRNDILETQSRLFESGYFSSLQLTQSPLSVDRLQPDFNLRVRERKPRFVTFRTGAGQSDYKDLIWDLSGTYGKRNFYGSRKYEAIADYSFSLGGDIRLVTHRYRLRFTEPWFLGIRMPLQLTGQYEPRLKDPVQDYKIESWSGSAATVKRFGDKIRTQLGFEYESVEILGVSEELKQEIKDVEGISVRRNLNFSFRRDSRDNLFIPTRGVYTEIESEYFGGFLGGDDNFTRVQFNISRYERVWPGWIMANRVAIGSVEQFGESEEVPINDRLYLGGANTVRGFRENRLGPLSEEKSPVGAKFTVVFNHEFRWRTIQIFNVIPLLKDLFATMPLWQSTFVDIGNGFAEASQFRTEDLAVTYGTGVQIVSPAGPIRLDYARVVPKEGFAFADRWHFTILYAF